MIDVESERVFVTKGAFAVKIEEVLSLIGTGAGTGCRQDYCMFYTLPSFLLICSRPPSMGWVIAEGFPQWMLHKKFCECVQNIIFMMSEKDSKVRVTVVNTNFVRVLWAEMRDVLGKWNISFLHDFRKVGTTTANDRERIVMWSDITWKIRFMELEIRRFILLYWSNCSCTSSNLINYNSG